MKTSFNHSTSKKVFTEGSSLEITAKTEDTKEKLKEDLEKVLKTFKNNPDKILDFIEIKGTPVYRIRNANKLLSFINLEEGFITDKKGFKGLYINLLISFLSKKKVKLSLTSDTMFLLGLGAVDPYYMIQQFHKWYAAKLNLPGFDEISQENFQKFLNPSKDEEIKELTIEEIIGLQEAIARDKEAIDFVVEQAQKTQGSKEALEKLKDGGAEI